MFIAILVAFILVPIAELYVIIELGGAIGVAPTLTLLILDSVFGALLLRAQGRTAWERFNTALANGNVPGKEVADGAMIVFGGALLLTPGFITDILGLCLLLPPTRALIRRGLGALAQRRMAFRWAVRGAEGANAAYRSRRPPQGSGYDVEGTATEVSSDPIELGPGGDARS